MKNKYFLPGLLIIACLLAGCKKEISISGQIVDEDTKKGIPGLKLSLDIVDKNKRKSVIGKELLTKEGGVFKIEKVSVPKEVLENPDRYKGKIILDECFCHPYEHEVDITFKKLPININIKTSYGAAIKGKIIDKKTRTPIPNVDIHLIKVLNGKEEEIKKERFKEGDFEFKHIKAEKVKLEFVHQHYKMQYSGDISLIPGKEEDIIIELTPECWLFEMPLSYKDDLIRIGVTERTRDKFKENNHPLSNQTVVTEVGTTAELGTNAWKIIDIGGTTTATFDVVQRYGGLCVSNREELKPITDPIPDLNNIFEDALNRGEFPERLREIIENRGFSLPEEVGVRTTGDKVWIIGREWLYILIEKGGSIEIYYTKIAPMTSQ